VLGTRGQDSREFLLWNTTSVQAPIQHLYCIKLSTKTQYLPQDQQRKETYLDLSLYRKMNSWLQLGVAFRGAQHVDTNSNVAEYRPQFITKIAFKLSPVKFTSTNRLARRYFSGGQHYFRYYHNLFIHLPSLAHWPKPYIGEEVFLKLNHDHIHLLRAYAGLHVIKHQHFKLDTFYTLQHSKSGASWYDSDIVGMNLNFLL